MRIEEEREMKAKWITPVVTALDKDGHVDVEGNKSTLLLVSSFNSTAIAISLFLFFLFKSLQN